MTPWIRLTGSNLGLTFGNTVWVDIDAAGYGWFIDSTPYDDAEFRKHNTNGELLATPSSAAYGDMDLLTVVIHELGHVLGFEDLGPEAQNVMNSTLSTGERHVAGDGGSQTQESPTRLVVMESADTEVPIQKAMEHSRRPWLNDFLVNAVNPNHDIRISLLGDDGEDIHHSNLKTKYSRRSRPWRV